MQQFHPCAANCADAARATTSVASVSCIFCQIADGALPAHLVLDKPDVLAFLDTRPLFAGHTLVIPRAHHETLAELPPKLLTAVCTATQRISAVMPDALGAQGSFIGQNNVVSQSVPHVHFHVVPRTKGDGLRGFFWPRTRYASEEEAAAVAATLSRAMHADR